MGYIHKKCFENKVSITGKQMEDGWNLSLEAQQIYNIVKDNNTKVRLQDVWGELQKIILII